jgi:hypothetical protein
MILAVLTLVLALGGIVASVIQLRRDGYRRVPAHRPDDRVVCDGND